MSFEIGDRVRVDIAGQTGRQFDVFHECTGTVESFAGLICQGALWVRLDGDPAGDGKPVAFDPHELRHAEPTDAELEAEADAIIARWMAAGCPLADGTHAHPGGSLEECEAKRDAERRGQQR